MPTSCHFETVKWSELKSIHGSSAIVSYSTFTFTTLFKCQCYEFGECYIVVSELTRSSARAEKQCDAAQVWVANNADVVQRGDSLVVSTVSAKKASDMAVEAF